MSAHFAVKLREKIVTKLVEFHVIVNKNSEIKWKQFSICSKHIVCLDCYHKRGECSPLAVTDAVRWWRHCWTALAWFDITQEFSNQLCLLRIWYKQCQFSKADKMPISTTYFGQI